MRRCAHLGTLLLALLIVADTAAAAASSSRQLLAASAAAAGGAPASAGAPADGVPSEHLLPCVEELLPCTAYLKTAKHPSPTCCTAMHNAAASEMPCLCRLFADPELLATFNVTRDQMFRLPSRCGLPVGCHAGTTNEPVVEAPPPPAEHRHHHHSASSRRNEFMAVWSVIAAAALGQMIPLAALV
ncbi:hypothetical protein U9M48_022990 [Paspalum notatum var. saurae]|uniref:Bifunctional inhibitor/plant lipid transfer protein/seed storage helical domain-containing protein n=1 Tax=Paspalum notatum var. saurae TaxID=547442 RepID=A0AAQ3TKZ1_PASNO